MQAVVTYLQIYIILRESLRKQRPFTSRQRRYDLLIETALSMQSRVPTYLHCTVTWVVSKKRKRWHWKQRKYTQPSPHLKIRRRSFISTTWVSCITRWATFKKRKLFLGRQEAIG